MSSFYVVRLGADSAADIERIDGPGAHTPMTIDVVCKQVPAGVSAGDFALIWLGTHNNKGGATPWVQGIRAFGEIKQITGGSGYNDSKTVSIELSVILARSLTKRDFIEQSYVHYREMHDLPVLGANNYSSQVIQRIDSIQPAQNLGALLSTIDHLHPGFKQAVVKDYPSLTTAFVPSAFGPHGPAVLDLPPLSYGNPRWEIPLSTMDDFCGLVGVEEAALRALAALRSGMHVIFTGPPGTGKTQLAECICRKAGVDSWTVPATDQWTTFETIGGYFPSPTSSDSATGEIGTDRLDFLPGAVVDAISRGKCLIVDEINRADIDKAFGELFTLLAGTSVTLPYRRRGANGFLRVRLQVSNSLPEPDIDVIPVPSWWRMIGAMNDADKASLKRLSLAFVRRFAFVPVSIPERSTYHQLLRTRFSEMCAGLQSASVLDLIFEAVEGLFCDGNAGFGAIGMPFGPAIPLAMLRQAISEHKVQGIRDSDEILTSLLELYVAPQFQGRADKHEMCANLIDGILKSETQANSFRSTLAIWTGHDG